MHITSKLPRLVGGNAHIPFLHDTGEVVLAMNVRHYDHQIFSYTPGDPPGPVTYHFYIPKLYEMVRTDPMRYMRVTLDLNSVNYQHILENNGIERDHLSRMTPGRLDLPGLLLEWPDDPVHGVTHTMLDGNHRYVFRHEARKRHMQVYVIMLEDAKRAMLSIPSSGVSLQLG